MSSFIKDYFANLRNSDEKTKNKSALFLSFILTVIFLSILFLFFKGSIFSINNQDTETQDSNNDITQNSQDSSNTKNYVVSPLSSFATFIKDSGEQFSKIKSDVSSTFSSSSNKN